jgi:selenide,water dikinase
MYDPQTSGGLLISVAANEATGLLAALWDAGVSAAKIGRVLPSPQAGTSAAIILK